MNFSATNQVKSMRVEAVKILADGTRVDMGTVAYYNSNPLKRLWFALKQKFK